jgi:hypothetical protein
VPPILFPSLRYIRRKPSTNLASRLALSSNVPNRASTWASSPRSLIQFVQNDFDAYGMCRCKPCSNLALTLTLSPNGLKQDSRWPTSLTSSIGCVQNYLWPMVRSIQTVHLSSVAISPNRPNRSPPDPHHLGLPRVLLKQFMNLWYVWCKPSTYLAPTLTLFKNRSKQDSTWPTSPRSFFGCLQYYFRAYGTFDANRAPILHQD